MSRRLIVAALLAFTSPALADEVPVPPDPAQPPAPHEPRPEPEAQPIPIVVQPPPAPPPAAEPPQLHAGAAPADMSDQAIGAEIGVAVGGRVTPGGLRVAGHYLYQLAAEDWFDGVASFTFGGGTAACFRDRMDAYICEHGLAQGDAFEVQASVRHFFGNAGGNGKFYPYLRGGVGIGYVRYAADSVGGLIIPLHVAGGLRVSVAPNVAITAELELELGFGAFNHSLGLEPQLGTDIIAGVEFRL